VFKQFSAVQNEKRTVKITPTLNGCQWCASSKIEVRKFEFFSSSRNQIRGIPAAKFFPHILATRAHVLRPNYSDWCRCSV